jgi:hypothetical protein
MPSLAQEFNISLSTVHAYIDEQRKLLRADDRPSDART